MKRILVYFTIAALALTGCTDYYEPVFGYDNLPETVPPEGGTYSIEYEAQRFHTKSSDCVRFEWEYRVLVCETVASEYSVKRSRYDFRREGILVDIPRNRDPYPKPVIIEASIHYDYDGKEWWGDWFPIASTVQLCY